MYNFYLVLQNQPISEKAGKSAKDRILDDDI